MSLTKISLYIWEKLNYSRPKRVWLVTSRLWLEKWKTFFYSVNSICTNLSLLKAGSAEDISGLIHLYYGLCVQLPCHIWLPEPIKFRNYFHTFFKAALLKYMDNK
jgi:hypothetical protein